MKHLCDGRRYKTTAILFSILLTVGSYSGLVIFRELYKNMLEAHRGKGRSRHSKENFSAKELQEAHANYEDEAARFVFRLQSLKKGQFQCLLTQATRHHAAQVIHVTRTCHCFMRCLFYC